MEKDREELARSPDVMPPRDKIKSLEELAAISAQLRHEGKTVVHCHGVYDLLHLGHVRHLEMARNEGDVLIVTVTADDFVNKGPGRPVFPDLLRAEMLGAMNYVDWVGINHDISAISVLEALQPDVYVKGSDYANPDDDITGNIQRERDTVESLGGRVVFTRGMTFSSSTLINQYTDVLDPELRRFLNEYREENSIHSLLDLIEKVKNYKVLIVGDAIVDEYQYIAPLGKSSKDNIIASLYQEKELFAGGAIAAANHVAGICGQVDLLTVLGDDDKYVDFIKESLKPNVRLVPIERSGVPTTRKCRFVESGKIRKLFEVYYMDDTPYDRDITATLNDYISTHAADYDLVMVTDFGHGLIEDSTIKALCANARFLAVNAQSNSANMGYNLITKYPRADFICIDAPEARLAAGQKIMDLGEVASEILPSRIECDRIILTDGAKGCVAYQRGLPLKRVPAFTQTVVDSVGAGDAFLSISSPLVAAGGDLNQVAFIGNATGAIEVGIVGNRSSVEKESLMKYITTLLK